MPGTLQVEIIVSAVLQSEPDVQHLKANLDLSHQSEPDYYPIVLLYDKNDQSAFEET